MEVVSTITERVVAHVPRVSRRTATLDGQNHLPHRVFSGLLVRGQGDLTGAAAMGGLSLKTKGLVLANLHDILFDQLVDIGALFAWKIAAIRKQGIGVNMISPIRYRCLHDEVAICKHDCCDKQGHRLGPEKMHLGSGGRILFKRRI